MWNLKRLVNFHFYDQSVWSKHPYPYRAFEEPSCSLDFPGGSDGKMSACNAGDLGLIPGLGRCPGEGNGNPLQHSRLENPMDGGA